MTKRKCLFEAENSSMRFCLSALSSFYSVLKADDLSDSRISVTLLSHFCLTKLFSSFSIYFLSIKFSDTQSITPEREESI